MTYLIIGKYEGNKQLSTNIQETEQEAQANVDALIALGDVNAFYVSDYNNEDLKYCVVDGVNKTVSWDTAQETQDIFNEDMTKLRTKRTKLLTETDYLALSDTTLTTAMTIYRQALRDLPATYVNNPSEVIYPDKPVE